MNGLECCQNPNTSFLDDFWDFWGCPNQSVLVSEIGLPQFSYFTTIWFHAQNQKILMILIPHILHWERTIERTGEWSQIRITLRLAGVM